MKNTLAVLLGTLMSTIFGVPAVMAQPACVTQNMAVPAGANTGDKAQPFFIDTTGLDFSTKPPTRDPNEPDLSARDGAARRDAAADRRRGQLHHRPDPCARAPETVAKDGVPRGTTTSFTMSSKDSVIYNPGLIRDDTPGCSNSSIMITTTAPGDKSNMVVTTSHPGTWTRTIDVYVPANYVRGTEAPFLVLGDGGSTAYKDLAAILDNLIQQRRVPPMIAIQIGNGGQDAQGSERGREYDTVSGVYTQFVEREVLPLVEQRAGVKLTKNPDGRATLGLSSSGAAAFTMAWYPSRALSPGAGLFADHGESAMAVRPVAARRRLGIPQPWAGPAGPNLNIKAGVLSPSEPPGAPLIPSAPTKPIRFWFAVGDQDLFYPNPVMADGMHDWVLAAERMAKVLADKGYHYQFVFARNSKHVDRPTVAQTLPSALEWLWKGYPAP